MTNQHETVVVVTHDESGMLLKVCRDWHAFDEWEAQSEYERHDMDTWEAQVYEQKD